MNAKKPVSRRAFKSKLARADAHVIQAREYDELPELTDDMLARARINKDGRPVSRMAERLSKVRRIGRGKPGG